MIQKLGNGFNPDYAPCPGALVREMLKVFRIPNRTFAQISGLPLKVIEGVLIGKHPLTIVIAVELEKLFFLPVEAWMAIEKDYREKLAKKKRGSDGNGGTH